MPTTRWDVYRIGDQNGPGLELVRPGVDIMVVNVQGVAIVVANQGGSSTRLQTHRLRDPNDRWWRLPAGTLVHPLLTAKQDGRNHVSWEPISHMPLADYLQALASMNSLFT